MNYEKKLLVGTYWATWPFVIVAFLGLPAPLEALGAYLTLGYFFSAFVILSIFPFESGPILWPLTGIGIILFGAIPHFSTFVAFWLWLGAGIMALFVGGIRGGLEDSRNRSEFYARANRATREMERRGGGY